MPYTADQCKYLMLELHQIRERLANLMLECVKHAAPYGEAQTAQHLRYGAGRRIGVIRTAVGNIFEKFPPDTIRPLDAEDLDDVQINLHAFVMNVYGIFENWAWAFIERHQLRGRQKGVMWIGMFREETRRYFPAEIRNKSRELEPWHNEYLKEYRDSLAHRVPLYVPPFHVRPEDEDRFRALEDRLQAGGFDFVLERQESYEELRDQQRALTHPTFFFLHSTSDDGHSRPVQLHPQAISDCLTVLDMGEKFFAHWHRMEAPG